MLDRFVAQIALDRAGVDAIVCELITARVTQHMWVYLHIEAGDIGSAFDHCLETPRRKRGIALTYNDEGGAICLPFKPPQGAKFAPGERVRRRTTLFDSTDVQDAAFQVDLLPAQVHQF